MSAISGLVNKITSDVNSGFDVTQAMHKYLANHSQRTATEVIMTLDAGYHNSLDKIITLLNPYQGDNFSRVAFLCSYFTNKLIRCPICGRPMNPDLRACSPDCARALNPVKNDSLSAVKKAIHSPCEIRQRINNLCSKLHTRVEFIGNDCYIPECGLTIHVSKDNIAFQDQVKHRFQIDESDNLDIWMSMIGNKLHRNVRVYARECEIHEVDKATASAFLKDNSLQGNTDSIVRLGLYYRGILVSVMTFGRPKYAKEYQWELSGFCSLCWYTVVGAASKLFKAFVRNYKPESVIGHVDRRFSQGDLYRILGFTEIQLNCVGRNSGNIFFEKVF